RLLGAKPSMAVQPIPLVPADKPANAGEKPAPQPSRPRMSTRNRLIFFLTAWLVVLMPFLFWWSTWFGRALTNKEMGEYLNDNSHPRHIQHAIVQLGQRMSRHDPSAARWYADPRGWTHRETARWSGDSRVAFADHRPRAHTFDGHRRQRSSRNCDGDC